MRKIIDKKEIGNRFVACQAAIVLLWFLSVSVAQAEEEFPEGMTEGEKTLMLQEMQEDIERDAPAYIDPSAEIDEPTDAETEAMIRDALPSQQELDKLAERYEDRVLNVADIRTGYDEQKALYRYILSGNKAIEMSTPLGGWADHAVALVPEEGIVMAAVMKDGVVVTDEESGEDGTYFFREPGNYAFMAFDETSEDRDYLSGSFRIVDIREAVTDARLSAPEGYAVGEVRIDGILVDPARVDPGGLELSRDGHYEVNFERRGQARPAPDTFRVDFVRDTTPPVIEWEGDTRDGLFTGDVHYSVPEKDVTVEIWYNGMPAVSPTQTLAASGSYYVTATDPTGNVRTYNFVLERQTQIPWILIGIPAGVLLLLAVIVVASSGRRMRIR